MSNFKIVLIGVFVLFIIIGVVLFATIQNNANSSLPLVTIWGTISNSDFTQYIEKIKSDKQDINVKYTQKSPETFSQDLVEAIASGNGPDIFLVPQDDILKLRSKISPIPYSIFPLRTFKDTFIQEGEMYLVLEGILGVPFTVDPLVMYWNRSSLSSAGIATPPKSWEEVLKDTPKLVQKDGNLNLKKSA
ncbi:carbohydrate ABC transporter substrate-binding protein, partial [Candidatus Nomurabacteria bacterium]|nr:carbohydrate ABC transporter substrate-binding protein [Candidatus Nomurabacteria bacterium]